MDASEQRRIFDDWLSRHQGLLFRVVHAYAGTAPDREDLFQEIVTQVWTSLPRFRAESAVTTWLYRISLNTALAWSRRERRHREQVDAFAADEAALLTAATRPDPRLAWLYEQIGLLDHVDRSLTLLLLDGCSYREMAETLGISETYVGVKLNRLKQHLRNLHQAPTRHGTE